MVLIVGTLFAVRIKNIEVEGNTKQENEELVKKIFTSDYDYISLVCFVEHSVLSHKNIIHVEKYNVKWLSPFSIVLEVYEKADIGYVKSDIKNVYFDKDGIVSDVSTEKKYGVPEVRGISIGDVKKGDKISSGKGNSYFNVVLNITSKLKDYDLPLELLELKSDDIIIAYLDKITVLLGNIQNMEIKLQRLNDIYPQIKDLSGTLDLSKASDNMIDEKYIFKKTA